MRVITWMATACLLLDASPGFAGDSDRLMRRARRNFEPLPPVMPGSENDTVENSACSLAA